jgi:hypothetical protein
MRALYEHHVPAAEAAAPTVAAAPAEGTPASADATDAADATETTETAATDGAAPPPPPPVAVPLVELALPEAFAKQLGGDIVGGKGPSSGTLPARWWGVAHDRALLQYTATHGLHLNESVWEGLGSTAAFAPPAPASDAPTSGGSSEPSSSSAPLPAATGAQHGTTPPATLKQALTRRDALLP